MDSDGSSTVALTVASAAWHEAFDALEPLARRVIGATLDRAAATPWLKTAEVSLLLTDDRDIRSLNAAYRDRDRPTNVLSFPALDLIEGETPDRRGPGPVLLGDVAISVERVIAEAAELGKSPTDHLAHLLVHGTLHLLGFDHGDDRAAAGMEGLETAILRALGFADPYAPTAAAGDRRPAAAAAMSVSS